MISIALVTVSFMLVVYVLTRMFNECVQEHVNVDRLRYVTLRADERHIAQEYDARLMSRRPVR